MSRLRCPCPPRHSSPHGRRSATLHPCPGHLSLRTPPIPGGRSYPQPAQPPAVPQGPAPMGAAAPQGAEHCRGGGSRGQPCYTHGTHPARCHTRVPRGATATPATLCHPTPGGPVCVPQLPGGTWHRSSRQSQHSAGSPSSPWQLRGLSTQRATMHTHAQEHTCNGSTATQPVVRGGGSVTLLLSPSDCLLQANHTPSPCLSFPTGAGGPSSFTGHEPNSSWGPGCWFCPGLGTPWAQQPAHTAVHTSAHVSLPDTRARSAQGRLTPPVAHAGSHAACQAPAVHTRVQPHTCASTHTHWAPPQRCARCAPAASPWQRFGFINGAAAGKRSWRGGRKWGVAESWRGQMGDRQGTDGGGL